MGITRSLTRSLTKTLTRPVAGMGTGGGGGGGFDFASAFGVGDFGVLWIPGASAGTFIQSDGTEPATADGDPAGYVTDFSGNDLHCVQSSTVVKPFYRVVNGIGAVGANTSGSQYATVAFSRDEDPDYTIYLAVDMAGQVSSSPFRIESGTAKVTDLLLNYPNVGDVSFRDASTISSNKLAGLTSTGRYIFKVVRSGSAYELTQLGGSSFSGTKSINPTLSGSNDFHLGGSFGGVATEMPIAFAMFINRALSAGEQSDYDAALLSEFSGW